MNWFRKKVAETGEVKPKRGKEYKVIRCVSSEALAKEVNTHINDGWSLHGGLVVSNPFKTVRPFNAATSNSDTETYIQAITR